MAKNENYFSQFKERGIYGKGEVTKQSGFVEARTQTLKSLLSPLQSGMLS